MPAKPRSKKPPRPQLDGDLLYGLHAVAEAWANRDRICHDLWLTDGAAEALAPALSAGAALTRPKPRRASRDEIDRLAPKGAVHQGALLHAAPLDDADITDILIAAESHAAPLVILLDQVTDPHNVGAVLRSAAAFGALGVITTRRNAAPPTSVMAKAASGAVEHCPYLRVSNLGRAITALKEADFAVLGLAEQATDLLDTALRPFAGRRIALVLGAEGSGLRSSIRAQCNQLARLPTGGPIGSLNISNAAAIALYAARRGTADGA